MSNLSVKIISPRKVLYESFAWALSSKNSLGKFDILPGHANFITLVENNPIIVHLAGKKDEIFNFSVAIIHCANDQVRIYTAIAEADFLVPEEAHTQIL